MPSTLYEQIADDLRRRILSGDLAVGDDVPSEGELAEQWRTSRGPIRNALAALRSEGLVETRRGRPARVVARKAHHPVDVSIPFTKWVRDVGGKPGARTQEVSLRRADDDKARSLGIEPGALVVDVVRLRLVDGRPTMLERLTFIEEVGRVLFDVDLDTVSITEYLDSRGFGYADIDHEIDAVAADELDAELLGVEPGTPILRLHRITRGPDGRTFEASDDRYRSDIVRFTVSASGRAREGDHFIRAIGP
ncbi:MULTISPECIES: GntR family transcriptional regulator [unclassified Frigoribacterium]|uniref:GntR family transcriptional regulator n=1 Tax=unclassified Frigoribacterium TaxID=2627005 RepID=UPI001563C2D1|nr:GntR family transcriptional regulator [Frigoribacterium sp. VKM Ac-2860]NQX09466.1 GntR family transcriptional regulator [Frigoribacterium sp. VKM Ac-2859]